MIRPEEEQYLHGDCLQLNKRDREVGEGAIFTWSSCAIHGLRLLHDTSAPPLTSFPLTSIGVLHYEVVYDKRT